VTRRVLNMEVVGGKKSQSLPKKMVDGVYKLRPYRKEVKDERCCKQRALEKFKLLTRNSDPT
jgi:hypothetical protein